MSSTGMDVQEDALRRGERPDRPGWGEEPPGHWGRVGSDAAHRPVPTVRGSYGEFYRLLAQALHTGGPMPVAPMDAVAALEVIEAARRSDEGRRVVVMS